MMTDFEPESAFIGALLHMPAPMAGQALDLIHNDDIADLVNQRIVTAARVLVAENVAPDPVAILARARADGTVSGAEATHALSQRLGELYGSVPTTANWRYYGMGVIDNALRRQSVALGTRVQQAAESCSLDVLIDVLDAECRVVRRLYNRRLAAAGVAAPHLRSVAG